MMACNTELQQVTKPCSMYKVSWLLLVTAVCMLCMNCFSVGVLGMCPGLQIIPSGNYHRHLTWDPPSTLNITAVEPDISSYIVCSNISTECTTIDTKEAGGNERNFHTFLSLRAYINFTVTALNIVGAGESASIVSEPCEYPVERLSNETLLAVVSFDSGNTPSLCIELIVSTLPHTLSCLYMYIVINIMVSV